MAARSGGKSAHAACYVRQGRLCAVGCAQIENNGQKWVSTDPESRHLVYTEPDFPLLPSCPFIHLHRGSLCNYIAK